MRCEDLTRELASPTGGLAPAEMAGHLADCPGCAEWSRRAALLDRAWEATRPVGPGEAALDALWAGASATLDARAISSTIPFEGRGRRRRAWAKAALVAAQAAAILAAAVFLSRRGADDPAGLADARPEVVTEVVMEVEPARVGDARPLDVVVEPGETALVVIGHGARDHRIVVQQEPTSDSSAIPDNTQFDVSRGVEAMLPGDDFLGKVAVR